MKRTVILSAIVLVGLGVWVHGAQQPPAPRPAIDPNNFTGTVTDRSISDIRTLRHLNAVGCKPQASTR